MDMVAATLAGNTLSLVVGSLTIGATLPRVIENGQAQDLCSFPSSPLHAKTVNPSANNVLLGLVPLVVPVHSSEEEGEVQEL